MTSCWINSADNILMWDQKVLKTLIQLLLGHLVLLSCDIRLWWWDSLRKEERLLNRITDLEVNASHWNWKENARDKPWSWLLEHKSLVKLSTAHNVTSLFSNNILKNLQKMIFFYWRFQMQCNYFPALMRVGWFTYK